MNFPKISTRFSTQRQSDLGSDTKTQKGSSYEAKRNAPEPLGFLHPDFRHFTYFNHS
jgi:hypothetical protein